MSESQTLPRVGSAVIVRNNAYEILLGKRNKDPERDKWVIPGGRIEAFESIRDAGKREVLEETGLEVACGSVFTTCEVINRPSEHRIVIFSFGYIGDGKPRPSSDLSEARFFSIQDIAHLDLSALTAKVLKPILLAPSLFRMMP